MVHAPGTPSSPATLALSVRIRLWIMMFLQYFAWGCWWVTLSYYIGAHSEMFEPGSTGGACGFSATPAIIAPVFVGMIADRFFSSERVLVVLHLAGAGI